MAKPKSEANQFDVHDGHTTISFATTSFTGKATFDYKAGDTHFTFTGSDIRLVDTEFSRLVTVSIDEGGDAGDSLVTLLVPKFSLLVQGEPVPFETVAIVTAIRRLGPARQHYRVLNLHGTAVAMVF